MFATIEGEPLSLNATSKAWAQVADDFAVGDVTLHGLRPHASQLIDAGVDIVTISKRLGHASPAIIKVYAHLFQQSDAKAADAINAALAGLGQK